MKKNAFFNFNKGQKVEGNINEIISPRNAELIDRESKKEKLNVKSDYFLIVEPNLPIFNDPILKRYADLFEFLDIPGLDEDNFPNNIYIKDLIPVIIPNITFSIFLFDSTKIHNDYSSEIIKLINSKAYEAVKISIKNNKKFLEDEDIEIISENISEEISLNSLYVINKIDGENYNKKAEYKRNVKDILEKDVYKGKKYFSIDKVKNNIIPLSAKNLLP